MTCVFRISGQDVQAAADRTTIKPYRVDDGVVHFKVSDVDFDDFGTQISDAIFFLRTHAADIKLLMSLPNASGILDFALNWRDVAVQSDAFSAELVREAGLLGLALEFSHYPSSEEGNADS